MSRLIVLLAIWLITFSDIILARPLEPIVWSVQNKIFDVSASSGETSHTDHTIEVKLGDFLNILCPKYSTTAGRSSGNDPLGLVSSAEYHAIYKVSRQEFDECRIRDIEKKQPVLKCDRPSENVKYTLYISKFSPVPDAIEFLPGHSYYFISTSNGMFSGLNNNQDGTCRSNNMKIIIKVEDSKKSVVSSTARVPSTSSSSSSSSTSRIQSVITAQATSSLRSELNHGVAISLDSIETSHLSSNSKPSSGKINSNSYAIQDTSSSSHSSPHNNRNGHNIRNYVHTRGSQNVPSSTYKPFRFTIDFTPSTKKSTITTSPTTRKTVATNDDIFILEPDSIDYNDLIAQLIQQQKQKPNSDIDSYAAKSSVAATAAASRESSTENEYPERSDIEEADAAFINAASSSSSSSSSFSSPHFLLSLLFNLVLLIIIQALVV